VSWPTAHAAFVEHADALLPAPQPTTVLGIDETRRGKPRWVRDSDTEAWRRIDPYDTGFVDLASVQGLLGQREGRTSKTVVDWLREQTPEFRSTIEFVAIDPAAVYAAAIRTDGLLPNARLVVDHFHLVKLANDCVTTVRRRTIWDQKGRRGRKIDPAWANRLRLLSAKERVRPKAFAAMWNALIDSDPSGQILTAWIAKEELRTLLALPALARPGTGSPASCGYSTTGARPPRSTSCTPWPARSRPGGRKSKRSSTPASPTPRPRASTGWSSRSSAPAAASATSITNTAEYGSTAPAPRGQRQHQQDHCPPKFEEPSIQQGDVRRATSDASGRISKYFRSTHVS
jgi:transposase